MDEYRKQALFRAMVTRFAGPSPACLTRLPGPSRDPLPRPRQTVVRPADPNEPHGAAVEEAWNPGCVSRIVLRPQPDRRMLRHAFRSLIRARWSTLLQLATIAIGVGGLSAVFAVVGAVVLRPLPFEDPQELVTIDVASSRGFSISTSIP